MNDTINGTKSLSKNKQQEQNLPLDLRTAAGSWAAPYDTSLSPPFLSTP